MVCVMVNEYANEILLITHLERNGKIHLPSVISLFGAQAERLPLDPWPCPKGDRG